MRKILCVLLCVFCAVWIFSGAAAADNSFAAVTAEKNLNKIPGFTVTPGIWNGIMTRGNSSGTVTQGNYEFYDVNVPVGSTNLSVWVTWNLEPDYNNLALSFLTPSLAAGASYDDFYESATANGIVPLIITANSGWTLPSGTWYFIVTGKSVANSQNYTITITCA